ncbi:hypothetical protein [Sporosarcina sp. A2]|uniref:hypothetical protein n=1 Tax=Sporosarcina sp. A2 TaxID=3393449 RepID=UPI003D7987BB
MVGNLVKGLDGKFLTPYTIGLRNTKTNKELMIDVDQLKQNATEFPINLSDEENGWYMLVVSYKLKEDTLIHVTYFVDNH